MKFRLLSLFVLLTVSAIGARIFLLQNVQPPLINMTSLSEWEFEDPADRNRWKVNEQGHIQSSTTRDMTSIFRGFEFPQVMELELRAKYIKSGFRIGFVRWDNKFEPAVRFHCLGGKSYVSLYERMNAIEKYKGRVKKVDLRIIWDRPNHKVTVYEGKPNGKVIFESVYQNRKNWAPEGIIIMNTGELTIEKLVVRDHLSSQQQ